MTDRSDKIDRFDHTRSRLARELNAFWQDIDRKVEQQARYWAMRAIAPFTDPESGGTLIDFTPHTSAADPHSQYLKESEFTAKGDVIIGTGPGTYAPFPVGSAGQYPTPDPSTETGWKWDDLPNPEPVIVGQYRQFLIELDGLGGWGFVTELDGDGNTVPVTELFDLE